jgi:23S rRNA pseudouridine2605 synthase
MKQDEKRTELARALSKMGYCSRTEAVDQIRDGRVARNGTICYDPEAPVRMGRDRITVDGKILEDVKKIYWMLNKPRGVVTTAADERGRATVYTLLPKNLPWLGPVGRLDMASEGLLLLTNDTVWAARITAPETHLEKTYHVQVNRPMNAEQLKIFETGIKDAGEVLKARYAKILRTADKTCWIEIVLDEGKNRQIRRMVEAADLEVQRLVRVAIGRLSLGELPKGEARPLTPPEIKLLK